MFGGLGGNRNGLRLAAARFDNGDIVCGLRLRRRAVVQHVGCRVGINQRIASMASGALSRITLRVDGVEVDV